MSVLGGPRLLGRRRWGDDGYRSAHRRGWWRGGDGDESAGGRPSRGLGSEGIQWKLPRVLLSSEVGPYGRRWTWHLRLLLLLLLLHRHQTR